MVTKETSDSASPEKPESQKKPKKRRWLRRMGWFAVFLGIIAFLVNGIVARKVIHHYLNQSLEAQGMTGTVEITGSILSGFEVKNLDYSGEKGIQSLSIDTVMVDYQIMQLIDLKVDDLAVKNLKTEIDIAKFQPAEKTDATTDWKQTLKELRPLIMHPKIGLENLDVTILKDGKKLLHSKLGSIQHQSQTDEIAFNQWTIADADNLVTPEQSAKLAWKEGNITFDRIKLLPDLTLGAINFDWKSNLKGDASLEYNSAVLAVNIAEKVTLKLLEGEIRSAEVFKTLSKFSINTDSLDMDVVLNQLDATIPLDNFNDAIPLWSVDLALGLKSARWETYSLENTTLNINQANESYKVNVDGTAIGTPLKLDIAGVWKAPSDPKWWESTSATVNIQTKLNDQILALIPALKAIPADIKINRTNIDAKLLADIKASKLITAEASIELSEMGVKDASIPTLAINASYSEDKLQFKLKPKDNSEFIAEGLFNIFSQDYQASFLTDIKLDDAPWIHALTGTFNLPAKMQNQLNIQWNGNGNIDSKIHKGELTTNAITLKQADQQPVTINFKAKYDWPKSLDIETLSVEQEELFAQASLMWDGKEILIRNSEIKQNDELIGSINGKLPFNTNIDTSKKFFAQNEPWKIDIDTEEIQLKRLADLIPLSKELDLTGTIQTKISVAGSPLTPELNGNIDIKEMSDILELGLDKVSLIAKINTKNKLLILDGKISENLKQLITLDIELPFTPHQWLEDDNLLATIQKNSEIKGSAEIKQLPLGRFSKFVPELEKLEGILDAKAEFQGTIAEPKYKIDFKAELPIVKVKNKGVDDITDIQIKGMLDETMVINSEVTAKLNGGKFITKIKVDVNDPKVPVFDVDLTTNHALVYRDDVLAMRSNIDIKLQGTLEDATITGNIGILESLFYKDVDLIPIGVPSSAVGDVTLPSLNTKATETLPIPEPFGKWKLDLIVKTIDPILIRGNVGSGQIQGLIKVRGTLAQPSLDGTLFAKKVRAKLPFSMLSVDNGQIIFSPNNGLIPTLEIRGKSQVGTYNVNLYAYGSADDPKITLSSYPALPENEIMTLLATGATNAGLANRDVATFKTLQILLQELKQRSDRPDGNRLFSKILSGIEDLDLKVGEMNQLTGEKYASATVKLHQRWYLTAQIDNDQPPQTRGLVIFALRFR